MKAAVYREYGPPEVVRIEEVEKPVPKDDEVLVRIHATTVTAGDWRARSLEMPPGFGFMGRLVFGFRRPRKPILGLEFAGVVESVGASVSKFKPGDAVFGSAGARMGCHAEYQCVRQDAAIVPKPEGVSFEEAAALPFGGTTALHFFRKGKLERGEKVIVNGAAGAVGTAAVQIANHFGAEVTGVCSTANLDFVRSIGADHVIDYTKDDFTTNGEKYDVIVDTAGTASYARAKKSLNERGRLLVVLGGMGDMIKAPFVNLVGKRRIVAGVASERIEYLQTLAELTVEGIYKPVIGRRYRFEDIVEAHRYVDTGHKRGNAVVTLAHNNP